MKIEKIEWMDEATREGILTLVDGSHRFAVFSWGCRFNEGDLISVSLGSLDEEFIYRIEEQEPLVKKLAAPFEHYIVARVADAKNRIVEVGQVRIKLGYGFPGDIRDGEYVEFNSARLDLI